MLTNFSSSIISGMGISLGCIDTTIDLLNSDPDLYDTEINEIKKNSLDCESLVDTKYIKPLTINRPIKPKLSRESIIKKYKLQVISNEKHDNEEIIDLEFTEDTEDFDFSFEDTAPNEAMSNDKNESSLEMSNANGQELVLEEDSAEDQICNIEVEEDSDNDDIDSIEVEEDSDDDSAEDDIDNINIDEDEYDIDNIELEEDSAEDDIDNIELEDEDEDIDTDGASGIESINIDDDDTDINEEDDSNADDFSVDDIDNIDIAEDEDNTLNTKSTHENIKSSNVNLTDSINTGSTKAENKEQQANVEIDKLKQQIANMEKKLQDINSSKAPNKASDIYDDKLNKTVVDNRDKLTSNAKVGQTQQHNSKPVVYSQYEKYNNMSIEALYAEVSTYMKISGVSRKTVDILTLNEEFGERNIRKLLQKSYLIKFGKGVTTGR